MKNTFLISAILLTVLYGCDLGAEDQVALNNKSEMLYDERDGNSYKIIQIAKQIWMAENLRFDSGEFSYCLEESTVSCSENGRLYSWGDMDFQQKISEVCPSGWSVPTVQDFELLIENIRSLYPNDDLASALKSKEGWETPGTNVSGFSAKPAGYILSRSLPCCGGIFAGFWTSDLSVLYPTMLWVEVDSVSMRDIYPTTAYSIRCIKAQ